MRNSKEVFREIQSKLRDFESEEEKSMVARILMQSFFALDFSQIIASVALPPMDDGFHRLRAAVHRINAGEPVQYVVGEAHFFGLDFFVDRSVLIPRPETEELVSEVLKFIGQRNGQGVRILDIGTGSGCIPITLALKSRDVIAMATDISPEALAVAARNASRHKVSLQLLRHDILNEDLTFRKLDIVISNPPYIANSERALMKPNVLEHEPHLALFVPDHDPLIFYRHIIAKAKDALLPGGLLIFEINERFGQEVKNLMNAESYVAAEIIRDLSGKDRIVKCIQPQ